MDSPNYPALRMRSKLQKALFLDDQTPISMVIFTSPFPFGPHVPWPGRQGLPRRVPRLGGGGSATLGDAREVAVRGGRRGWER